MFEDNSDESGLIGPNETADAEKALIVLSRDAMRWIYKQLQKEYEYQTADEQIVEGIEANGYTFTEDGKRFG